MKKYYVYILKCNDNSFYTGVTNNLERRIVEHNLGKNKNSYTYSRRPLELVWREMFQNINEAILKEKQLKGWSRKKKEALVASNFKELIKLSKNKQRSSTSSD